MAHKKLDFIFVGIKGTVVALERTSGIEAWRMKLKVRAGAGGQVVHLHRDREFLFASTGGEVFCLRADSGTIVWHNPMKGLGLGLASMVTDADSSGHAAERQFVTVAEQLRRQAAAAHGGAGA